MMSAPTITNATVLCQDILQKRTAGPILGNKKRKWLLPRRINILVSRFCRECMMKGITLAGDDG